MAVTPLNSIGMAVHNIQTHWRQRLMCQDGNTIQHRQTKSTYTMDKGSSGKIMELYTLGNKRMAAGLKARSMSCKEITLTHFYMSSMKKGKRQRRKK